MPLARKQKRKTLGDWFCDDIKVWTLFEQLLEQRLRTGFVSCCMMDDGTMKQKPRITDSYGKNSVDDSLRLWVLSPP